jgi:hypothetical protein
MNNKPYWRREAEKHNIQYEQNKRLAELAELDDYIERLENIPRNKFTAFCRKVWVKVLSQVLIYIAIKFRR